MSGSWDKIQNAFSQSNCRISESFISLEQSDEIAWFLHVDTVQLLKIES